MNARRPQHQVSHAEIQRIVALARSTELPEPYAGKRKHPRYICSLALEATKDPDPAAPAWTMNLLNVSCGGFAAWSKTAVDQHDMIFVRDASLDGEHPWLEARVRHCDYGLRGYLVGAEFVAEMPEAVAPSQSRPMSRPMPDPMTARIRSTLQKRHSGPHS